jgi:hypothetical protein
MGTQQKDNSTFRAKVALRQRALMELGEVRPVVLETHAGFGKLFGACYSDVREGMAFEMKPEKAAMVAKQRPTWSVYESDCEKALALGVGDHLAVNFVDFDPYGQPWPAIDAFLESDRPRPARLVFVVNDGLRQKLQLNGGWDVESMREMVERFGNRLYSIYLDICQLLVKEKAARAGYRLSRWNGYYCGHGNAMTHYAAVLDR